jgi:hypothetical protein
MITQLAKIQNKQGKLEDLPNPLDAGEFGWTLDTQQLYIGNGAIADGAPYIGNTEILTEHSDLSLQLGLYQYSGTQGGLNPTAASTVKRSFTDKMDDTANLRDWGGTGDGQTDNSTPLNTAIIDLYRTALLDNGHRAIRRTLNLSAGTYILSSDFLRLLPFVKLKGEGKNSTFIIQTNSHMPCAVSLTDSLFRSGFLGESGQIGTAGAYAPQLIEIEDITILNATNNNVLCANSIFDMYLRRVALGGPKNIPTLADSNACLNFATSSSSTSSMITLLDCDLYGQSYGVILGQTVSNLKIQGGSFQNLVQGVNAGQFVVGAKPSVIKVTGAIFDNIAREGIFSPTGSTNVVSAFNTYLNVGNNQSGSPVTPNINFNGDNSYSIGDTFGRLDTNAIPLVSLNGYSSFATMPNGQMMLGRQLVRGGQVLSLAGIQPSMTALSCIVGMANQPTIIDYSITSSDNTVQRIGSMKITPVGISCTYEDDYVQNTDTGVTLKPVLTNGTITLQYEATSGISLNLTVSSKTLF